MKKTRFLWIRDLPAKCRDNDIRGALERHGAVQKIRMLKDGHVRHAIVAFADIKSAVQAVNAGIKINDTFVKVDYCVSTDSSGLNMKKVDSNPNSTHTEAICKKEPPVRMMPVKKPEHQAFNSVEQASRCSSTLKHPSGRVVSGEPPINQVLRPVENSVACSHPSVYRGLKLSNLPSVSKLSDTHLRQGLFTEFRRCGRILSVVLPKPASANTGEHNGQGNVNRIAIITFRRPEEAECAYRAIQSGEKMLFSTSVSAELHAGFESSEECYSKFPSSNGPSIPTTANRIDLSTRPNAPLHPPSCQNGQSLFGKVQLPDAGVNAHSQMNKSPTRTLYVAGLTVGPTGPVTSEQLTTAFRKFGDIIDVQLRTSSNAALIQFAEMRGPIRAMNAHSRDPLRLGGRPLSLAYAPSPPSTGLWLSDLPPSLAALRDEDLLHTLSQTVPVQEIVLINRADPATRPQLNQAPSTSNALQHQVHYAAYLRLASTDHASRLLSELRSGKHFETDGPTCALSKCTSLRRTVAVDFASPRQITLVASLQLSAAKSPNGSARIRIISAANIDPSRRSINRHVSRVQAPSSSAIASVVPPPQAKSSTASTLELTRCSATTATTNRPSRRQNPASVSALKTSAASAVPTPCAAMVNIKDNHPSPMDIKPKLAASKTSRLSKSSTTLSRPHKQIHKQKTSRSQPHQTGDCHSTSFSADRLPGRNDRIRDSSASSLSSTSSSSSSLSSESSSSSSSSTSSLTSSSVSSLSSSSASSVHSRSHRPVSVPSAKSKSDRLKSAEIPAGRVLHRARTSRNSDLSSASASRRSPHPSECKSADNPNTPVLPNRVGPKSKVVDDLELPWINTHTSTPALAQRPLSVVTTIAPAVLSPARSSAASSGGLSSPGGSSSSTAITGLSSSLARTPTNGDGLSSSVGGHPMLPSGNAISQHPSNVGSNAQHAPSTAAIIGEFRVSPAARNNLSCGSSGVSSACRSFSSTSSNSSSGSSPLNNGLNLGSHQTLTNTKAMTTVTPSHYGQTKSSASSVLPSVKNRSNILGQSNNLSPLPSNTVKRPCSQDTLSNRKPDLKLHLSTNCCVPPSSAASGLCSPVATAPLTVSIRLTGPGSQSQCATVTSPSSMSAHGDAFCSNQDKQSTDSLPSTPVSAPPLNTKSARRVRTQSTEVVSEKVSFAETNSSANPHSADWLGVGSPVYESMYDKIKRRTNKEAEERRQRQMEALNEREKKRRKQKKKDQLAKSSPSNVPFTPPGSFGSDQSAKTFVTSSSGKSHHSKSTRAKDDSVSSRTGKNRSKNRTLQYMSQNGDCSTTWHSASKNHSDQTWPHKAGFERYYESECRSPTSTSKITAHKIKRRRRNMSSLSSSLSSGDERNSVSPPETLTRLSLGMRFPVSATYHECVHAPKDNSRPKWSADEEEEEEEDGSLSRFSSSLSCSSSESKPRSRFTVNKLPSPNRSHSRSARVQSTTQHSQFFGSSPNSLVPSCPRGSDSGVGKLTPLRAAQGEPGGVDSRNYSRLSHDDRFTDSVKFSNSTKKAEILKSKQFAYERTKIHSSKKSKHNVATKRHHTDSYDHKLERKRQRVFHESLLSDHHQPPHSRHLKASELNQSYDHRVRSPKPYFSDDGTVLDSEIEDIRCSDSISHTTGTSETHGSKHNRRRRLSNGVHSGSDDDSSLIGVRSPSPAHCQTPLHLISHHKRPNRTPRESRDDSLSDASLDSDRFSTDSKSTPSTEPMEQSELNDRNSCLKFSDEEWHSSIISNSPHPNNSEFDVDECPVEKTDHSSTAYHAASFLSPQLVSPVGKMPTPPLEDSDEDMSSKSSPKRSVITTESEAVCSVSVSPKLEEKLTGTVVKAESPAPCKCDEQCALEPVDQKFEVSAQSSPIVSSANSSEIEVLSKTSPCPPLKPPSSSQSDPEHHQAGAIPKVSGQDEREQSQNVPLSTVSVQNTPAVQSVITPQHSRSQVNLTYSPSIVQSPTSPRVHPADSVCALPQTVSTALVSAAQEDTAVMKSTSAALMQESEGGSERVRQSACLMDCASASLRGQSDGPEAKASSNKDAISSGRQPAYLLRPLSSSSAHPSKSHTHSADVKTAPGVTSSSSGSLTEAHDITRYVQSVIERVKAERVEETQQAAAAAAHHRPSTPHHLSVNTSLQSAFLPTSPAQTSRLGFDSPQLAQSPGASLTLGGKRVSGTQRRPLLVTTSSCSSFRAGTPSKWLTSSSLQPTSDPDTSVTTSTGAISAAYSLSPAGLISTGQLIPTTEVPMPSIPGVNACAPLTVSPSQPSIPVSTRVTRQSQANLLHSNVKRSELGSSPDTQPAKLTNSGNASSNRRRRKSEGKSVSVIPATNKDITTLPYSSSTSLTSPTVTSSVVTSTLDKTSGTALIISAAIKPAGGLEDVSNENVHQSTTRVSHQAPVPITASTAGISNKNSSSSIDPYEPNFDEESPIGFDHGQLHHHRSSSPVCSSPVPHTNNTKKVPVPAHVSSISNASTTTTTTTNALGSSPVSTVSCFSPVCSSVSVDSVSSHPLSAGTTGSLAPAVAVTDSVDEVIRDVCAGQFDVQSYLNNWRSEHPSPPPPPVPVRTIKSTASPKITPTPLASTAASITASTASVPLKVNTNSLSSSAKPFPLAIASEPVVAAVTIPVSSNTSGIKPVAPGKNGSNNVVNIGTGNALLNTLLAALQLIPGSHITVTGPAAAAGVGGVGSGTISATTITLPVGATRQAAANIKAAFLSATNNLSNLNAQGSCSNPISTTNQNKPSEKACLAENHSSKPPSTSATPTSVTTSSTESVAQASSVPIVHNQLPVRDAVPTIASAPAQTVVDNQTTNVQAVGSKSVVRTVCQLTKKVSPTVFEPPSFGPTVSEPPAPCIQPVKLTPSMNSFRQTLNTSTDRPTVTSSPARTMVPPFVSQLSSHLSTPNSVPSTISSTAVDLQAVPSVNIPQPGQVLHRTVGNGNAPYIPSSHPSMLASSTLQQQSQVRNSNRAPASSHASGRSPPLSAPPLTSHALQTLVERLNGVVEPSVLMALAQAAVSNAGFGSNGGMNEPAIAGEAENQAFSYLRRLSQHMIDTRTSNGPPPKHLPAGLMDTQGKTVIPRILPSSSPAANISAVPLPSPQHRVHIPPSSMCLSAINPDIVPAVVARSRPVDTSALISPPIGPNRQTLTNNPATTHGTTQSNRVSWNNLTPTYPLVWQGRLSLKNAETRVALHYIHGNPNLLHDCMRLLALGGGGQPQHMLVNGGPLRIVQRMRLEPTQLEGVQRKIHQEGASCACLALPAGSGPVELMHQTQVLNDSFIRYMQEKMAAGIINVGYPDCQQGLYVVHIFPPCDFSHAQLSVAAPELHRRVVQANQSHLLVVITTV
ncbi:unnamed protein product [Calicophoron daubneyi]|uniref:Msx2-interacting protein n=1 Tax=Calicophoron daubneyi TaxID=300641 RepID=A0AAV2T1C6_CALDB